jgi:hypothetical protein
VELDYGTVFVELSTASVLFSLVGILELLSVGREGFVVELFTEISDVELSIV